MAESYHIEPLTRQPWANLYRVHYRHRDDQARHWLLCSRKQRPIDEAGCPDAVVIVATVETSAGRRLVVTREFRVPLWDYEVGFPAGLIDPGETIEQAIARELKEETGLDLVAVDFLSRPVYSSAGLTDESCIMALVRATGTVSRAHQEPNEDIQIELMDVDDIGRLLHSDAKIAAKAWGLLLHYHRLGRID